MSDHQDHAKQLPDNGGRFKFHPRSDVEHAAKKLLQQAEMVLNPSDGLRIAMEDLRAVLGEVKS